MTANSEQWPTSSDVRASLQLADADGGGFYAPFAFRNVVTSHLTILRPEAFEAGQAVPFRVGHPQLGASDLRAVGVGRIEVDGDVAALRGKFTSDDYGQGWRSQLQEQIEMGYAPQVSVGIDWHTWELGGRDMMTDDEKRAVGEGGRQGEEVLLRAPRTLHLALVDGGAVPGAMVASVNESANESAGVDAMADWRASVARKARAALLYRRPWR